MLAIIYGPDGKARSQVQDGDFCIALQPGDLVVYADESTRTLGCPPVIKNAVVIKKGVDLVHREIALYVEEEMESSFAVSRNP